MTLDVARLDLLVRQIPHEAIARQRWFRSKGRAVVAVTLEEAAPLVADPAALDAVLLIVRVGFADRGGDELYLLPMILGPGAPDPSPDDERREVAVRDPATGDLLREPRDGDGAWRALLAGIAAEVTLPGLHGSFAFHALQPIAAESGERRLGAEQSNTSVALGDELLLKLYRRLEPGENPDLELPRFLTEAGFDRVPAVAGYVRYIPGRGEPLAAVMLQVFLRDAVDAWRWLLGELTAGRPALEALARIGQTTARMHAALASRPDDPAFPARAATAADRAAWRAAADEQLRRAAAAGGVAEHAAAIRRGFGAIDRAATAQVSRIHGDFHLGQLLRSQDDFWVIDFEGEPARPLAERRRPGSPLKDVAGMLRSLDYAARSVERNPGVSGFDPDGWLEEARQAFLQAYRSGGREVDDDLLRAFELEKACYEVHYEANNRPDWTWLPVQALERLAGQAARR